MAVALGFRHEALFYRGVDELLTHTVPFLSDGARAGDAMLVVLQADANDALRAALGEDASAVRFADMAVVGRNPARIIPAWQEFVDEHAASGRALRGIGEPIGPHRVGAELDECHRHEALLNVAFGASGPFQLVCPYDTDALAPEVVAEARRTHPLVHGGTPSTSYAPVDEQLPFALPFADAPPSHSMAFAADTLGEVRRFVRRFATGGGVDDERAADLVLAANEIATNSVLHGGGTGELRMWWADRTLICEITDRGLITDPLLGRRHPSDDLDRGRGHWMANQLCDLVRVASGTAGTAVRLHLRAG